MCGGVALCWCGLGVVRGGGVCVLCVCGGVVVGVGWGFVFFVGWVWGVAVVEGVVWGARTWFGGGRQRAGCPVSTPVGYRA